MSEVSKAEALRARKLFARQVPRHELLAAFGGQYTFDELCLAVRQLRNRVRVYQAAHVRFHDPQESKLMRCNRPSPETLERQSERLMLRHTNLTALICGDPLPTESALDRRNAHLERAS